MQAPVDSVSLDWLWRWGLCLLWYVHICMYVCLHVCIMCCGGVSLCRPLLAWGHENQAGFKLTEARQPPSLHVLGHCSSVLDLEFCKLNSAISFSWTDYDKYIGNNYLVLSLLQCFHKWGKDFTALTIPWWSESGHELGELGIVFSRIIFRVEFFSVFTVSNKWHLQLYSWS